MNIEFSDIVLKIDGALPQELAEMCRNEIVVILWKCSSQPSPVQRRCTGSADIFAAHCTWVEWCVIGGQSTLGRPRPIVLYAGHVSGTVCSDGKRWGSSQKRARHARKYNTAAPGHPGRDMELPGIERHRRVPRTRYINRCRNGDSDNGYCKQTAGFLRWPVMANCRKVQFGKAAMSAYHFGENNFCWIIGQQRCQIDSCIKEVMDVLSDCR